MCGWGSDCEVVIVAMLCATVQTQSRYILIVTRRRLCDQWCWRCWLCVSVFLQFNCSVVSVLVTLQAFPAANSDSDELVM